MKRFFLVCSCLILCMHVYSFEDKIVNKYFSMPKTKLLVNYSYKYEIITKDLTRVSYRWQFIISENYNLIINPGMYVLNLKEKGKNESYLINEEKGLFFDDKNDHVSVLFEKTDIDDLCLMQISITSDLKNEDGQFLNKASLEKVDENKNKIKTNALLTEKTKEYKELELKYIELEKIQNTIK